MSAVAAAPLTAERALAIAAADATPIYRDLSRFRVEIVRLPDGWHVDYFIHQLPGQRIAGGGPHYVIHADTGQIVSKSYHQ